MKVIVKKGFEFIPEFNGNKDLEEKEQIKLHFKFLSGLDFENLIEEHGTKYTVEHQFIKTCHKIDNLIIEEDGKEREADAKDIINEPAFFPLYVEAKTAYLNSAVVSEETKKK